MTLIIHVLSFIFNTGQAKKLESCAFGASVDRSICAQQVEGHSHVFFPAHVCHPFCNPLLLVSFRHLIQASWD